MGVNEPSFPDEQDKDINTDTSESNEAGNEINTDDLAETYRYACAWRHYDEKRFQDIAAKVQNLDTATRQVVIKKTIINSMKKSMSNDEFRHPNEKSSLDQALDTIAHLTHNYGDGILRSPEVQETAIESMQFHLKKWGHSAMRIIQCFKMANTQQAVIKKMALDEIEWCVKNKDSENCGRIISIVEKYKGEIEEGFLQSPEIQKLAVEAIVRLLKIDYITYAIGIVRYFKVPDDVLQNNPDIQHHAKGAISWCRDASKNELLDMARAFRIPDPEGFLASDEYRKGHDASMNAFIRMKNRISRGIL